ncbi:nSTAND1 domain-containing NTPase [Paraliomyxa miuraensis]|uniref:nSTAND1 domain-containing NTPase n=1 Tax=Paraliomyxa miuraensis TaxID=376150 RepID=UPI00224F4161|nr:hypothetical protein [Paraliomyxa miuraensis]MCX4240774.1 ATP-binding protein [Paraliomyxa miuraensis]
MNGTSSLGRNPFVGPRPIQKGETLHGRARELRELFNRLQARRIVVLHSPSGAGKSSLVQAGLIPRLEAASFDVWKPIRVNLDPTGLPGVPVGINRYRLSAMVSLEDELPPAHRRSPEQLAALDFAEYLRTRPRRKHRAGRNVVLLFDQFEEVLTTAPLAVEAKHAFFSAVGRALEHEDYWALFIIREDHLAAFAPYRDKLPTQLSNTFRLDLLGLDGAREAAVELARQGGRSFPAVDALIRDLSTIRTQQPDGSFVVEQDVHVEPVHLQVVCRRLWDAMPKDDPSIDEEDIDAYASVSEALGAYYADAVRSIAKTNMALERSIREWVGETLIVGGIRSQVRQETNTSAGLDNRHIERLLDSYLVRAEQRAGANWFELSHDRLVEPILHDNDRWEQAHLHPLQVQAKLWEDGKRDRALLLRPEALIGALLWARNNPDRLTEGDREFLAWSESLRKQELRRRVLLLLVTATFAVVAILAVLSARKAQRESQRAHEARLAAVEAGERAEQASLDARRKGVQLQAALEKADFETRAGRDLLRLSLAQFITSRASVSKDDRRVAAGLLADMELEEIQEQFKHRIPQQGWELLLSMILDLPRDQLDVLSSLRSMELRALMWSMGRCPPAELHQELMHVESEVAEASVQHCEALDACWKCRGAEDCVADPETLRLPPARQREFERCHALTSERGAALRHQHHVFDTALLDDDFLEPDDPTQGSVP